jgi:membrane protein required for colicin V production
MHWLDITLLIVLALGALLGARRGLLWQVTRILTFALAIYVCIYYHETVAGWIAPYLKDASALIVSVLSYVAVFLVIYLVSYGVTLLLEAGVKAAKLKTTDRILGAALGALKAALLSGAVLMGLALVGIPQTDEAIARSQVAQIELQMMRGVIVAVPQDYKEQFAEARERIQKTGAEKARELADEATRRAIEEQLKPK